MSEKKGLIVSLIVVILFGISIGLYLGDDLPFQATKLYKVYAERTLTTKTVTAAADGEGKYTKTVVVTATETTPHGYFHDFFSRMVSGITPTPTVAIPARTGDEIWVMIEDRTPQGTTSIRAANEIWLGNQEFNPGNLTVPPGTTVTWVNRDSEVHTVTSVDGLFNGYVIPTGSFSYTFTEPGTYSFFCEPHTGMAGTIYVK